VTSRSGVEIGAGRKDATGLAVLTLAHELWVLKDRQMITEALLAERGLLDAIDTYQPTAELAANIARERERFIGAITTILLTGTPADL
jgi:hypothetical protein